MMFFDATQLWYGLCCFIMLEPWSFYLLYCYCRRFIFHHQWWFVSKKHRLHYVWNAYHKYWFVVLVNFFQFVRNPNIELLNKSKTSCNIFNCNNNLTVLQSLAQLYDDSIQLRLSLCHHQLQKVDQNVGHLSVRNLQNEIIKTNSCVLLNN